MTDKDPSSIELLADLVSRVADPPRTGEADETAATLHAAAMAAVDAGGAARVDNALAVLRLVVAGWPYQPAEADLLAEAGWIVKASLAAMTPRADPAPRKGEPTSETPPEPTPEETESARRKREYRTVISAITHAIEQSGIWPNALNGWRRKDKAEGAYRVADAGDDDLRADFLHQWRWDGKPGERLIGDGWEKVVRDMRTARRAELVAGMTTRASTDAGRAALREWVKAVAIGKGDDAWRQRQEPRLDFLVSVMRHWMWGVKRYALGLPVERELMVVMFGKQASGKTWAIEMLAAPWDELSLPITAAALTDERQSQVLYRGLIARWDELEGAHKADVDALKRSITSKTIAFRNLYSNAIQERLRTCSFIASTNLPVRQVIKDTTGSRRYVEIETPDRCDWDTLNKLDARLIWEAVSENDAPPIKAILAALGEHQRGLVHQDPVCAWLAAEAWADLVLRSPDSPKIETVPGYLPSRGLSFHELCLRQAHWARSVSQPTVPVSVLGARLRQLGFADPVRHRGDATRPAGRYYSVPDEILTGTAPWMGPADSITAADAALAEILPDV